MAGYIGSKSSVTQVDGYNKTEADAEFLNDPASVITVSGSNVGIGTATPTSDLSVGSTTTSSGEIALRTTKTAARITPSNTNAGGLDISVGWVSGGQGPLTFSNNSGETMRIDSAGRVTMPYQPAFQAWSNSGNNQHFAGGTNPSFLTIASNVGNHFNGTTFTAPVSGRYLFFYTILSGSSGDYGLIALNVNGGPAVGNQNWTQHYTTTTNDQQNSAQQILTLSANDQVNLYIHPSYNHFYWNGAYSKFGGYLIG